MLLIEKWLYVFIQFNVNKVNTNIIFVLKFFVRPPGLLVIEKLS